MKLGIKCFIALFIVAVASFCVSASDTTTKFQTGPFTVSVDLGVPCNDVNISKPASTESLGGESYTVYDTSACGVEIWIKRCNKDTFTTAFPTAAINAVLVQDGADKDTIALYDRTIDGKSGAAGSGYVPKFEKTIYLGAFAISAKSLCYITIWDNQTMMVSALKTIHVKEAAT